MARVTVEDCILRIPNRFELVMTAAQRARDIAAGAALTVDRDNDKDPVVALREIADETVETGELRESLIRTLQKHVEPDEPEEDEMDLAALQRELGIVVSDDAAPRDGADAAAGSGTETEKIAAADDDVPTVEDVFGTKAENGAEGNSDET